MGSDACEGQITDADEDTDTDKDDDDDEETDADKDEDEDENAAKENELADANVIGDGGDGGRRLGVIGVTGVTGVTGVNGADSAMGGNGAFTTLCVVEKIAPTDAVVISACVVGTRVYDVGLGGAVGCE